MAKEFDFKKAGKKQKAFRTPMLNAKVSPAQARLAGKRKQELARNPQGSQYGFDPGVLSFALPLGKVAKAAEALRAAGNAGNRLKFAAAEALESRIAAKVAGKGLDPLGRNLRKASEGVFPRAPKKGALGDLEAGALPGSNMTNVQARRLAASRAADKAGNYTPVRELEKRLSLSGKTGYKAAAKEIARTKMAKSSRVKVNMGPRVSALLNDYLEMNPKRRGK